MSTSRARARNQRQDKLARVDISLLACLPVLVAECSVSATARRLGMSQSAVSSMLARLRRLFDDPLMVRMPHGVTPTKRAIEITEQLKPLLVHLDSLLKVNAAFDPKTASVTFRIAMSDQIQAVVLPALIPRLRREAPNLRMDIHPSDPLGASEKLRTGEIDLAVGHLRSASGTLRSVTVYMDRLVFVAAAKNPYLKKELTRESFSLIPQFAVSAAVGSHYKSLIEESLTRASGKRVTMLSGPNFMVAPEVVASTDLVAILPERFTRLNARAPMLKISELPFPTPKYDVRLYWHERSQSDESHRWLREQIVIVGESLSAKRS